MTNYTDSDGLKCFLAKIISYICEAPFLAIFLFIILNFFLNYDKFLLIETISLCFATILPIVLIVSWSKIKKVDKDYTVKETRNYPFLIAVAIYFIGAFILWLSSANPLTIVLMFCYGSNTLIVFFINLKWKISVHAMGVTGPTTALMFFTPLGFLLGLLAPLVMWSRITLKKHTISQVLAGSILGYILTFVQIYYLLKIMHFTINVDITLMIWIIIGLILISLVLTLTMYMKKLK
jgi:membrane-associated phospholipid phosphatase